MTPPVVSVRDLFHSYKNRGALRGINLDVAEGELVALLGPNGSGKTTLFKIMTTGLLPSAGDVFVNSASVVSDPQSVRRKIGVVFQSFGLDMKLTVRENLVSQGHLYGLQGQVLEGRIQSMLEEFDIHERREDLVEVLSGGLQRRVELAKGMLHAPTILFLDEPSTGLDPGARLDFWSHLEKKRKGAKITVMFTTHLIEEADRSDRVAIIDRGSIVAIGAPGELKREIGGDVISLKSRNAERLAGRIKRRFGVEVARIDDELRIEWLEGHRLIPRLAEAFGSEIEAVALQKPTLEDVFVRHTGRHLRGQNTGALQ